MATLVCFAVKEEAAFFSTSNAPPAGAVVEITGMGERNAAAAICTALDTVQPKLVLTCGFAGGLNPSLPFGSILFSQDEDCGLSSDLLRLGAFPGRFHASSRIVTTVAEKRTLRELTGADAVEMESSVIRRICRDRGISSATIRVILDSADDDLPLDFNAVMNAQCELNYFKLAWALLRAPRKIVPLLRLQRQSREAARRLGALLRNLGDPESSSLGV